MIGLVVGCLLLHATSIPLKWPVAPVSAIVLFVGGEEPRVGGASIELLLTTLLLLSLGVPQYQVVVTGMFWLLLFAPS
jgi:hypothetical protein